jgi:hypothetical protein
MKFTFRTLFLTLAAISGLASCREDSKLPAPKLSGSVPLIIPVVSADTAKQYLNYARTRASSATLATLNPPTRPVFEFSFNLDNTRDKKVQSVEVYKSFKRIGSAGATFGNRVLVGSYTSFPVTVSLNSQDLLTDLNRIIIPSGPDKPYLLAIKAASPTATNIQVQRNDAIVFTFEYVLEDGSRVVLTPLNYVTVGAPPGGTVPANTNIPVLATTTQVNAPYSIEAVIRDPIK